MHILIALVALLCTCGVSFANKEAIHRAKEGSTFRMICTSTQSSRAVSVEWKKVESEISINLATGTRLRTADRRFEVDHPDSKTWQLSIKQLRPDDSGLYVCEMTRNNIVGSEKFRLIVGDEPASSAISLVPMFMITSMATALAMRLL